VSINLERQTVALWLTGYMRDGTDLWIVYDEAVNTDRYSYTPMRPVSQGRALMVKYTHTLVW